MFLDGLFVFSLSKILISSKFIVSNVFTFLLGSYKLVSSANVLGLIQADALSKSLKQVKNNKDLKIEPFGIRL